MIRSTMKSWVVCFLATLVLLGASTAQQRLTPEFKESALDAFEAVKRIPTEPHASEAETALTKTDASKALDLAHRRAKSAADKSVYQLLATYYGSAMSLNIDYQAAFDNKASLSTVERYTDSAESDMKRENQCELELRVALDYDVDMMSKENLAQANRHVCVSGSDDSKGYQLK